MALGRPRAAGEAEGAMNADNALRRLPVLASIVLLAASALVGCGRPAPVPPVTAALYSQ